MKILQVTAFYSPAMGGSAESSFQLSRELVKKGHQVTVYTSDYRLKRDYMDAVPQIRVYPFKTITSMANFYVTPGLVRKASEDIKQYDVIHMHNYRTFQNVFVHHYAMKYHLPYVLQARGSIATYFYKGFLKKVFDAARGRKILHDASRVFALTPMEVEQYKALGVSEENIEEVPNGIDLAEFENLPGKGEFRRKYGLDNDYKIILFLGRIHKIKGLDLLVNAFQEISRTAGNTVLVIAGPDDGFLHTVKKLVEDSGISSKVLFTGPLYGQEKLRAYIDSDVYVLPSIYEAFPRAVLEALACGTPVIVTDRCGLANAIDKEAGIVVPYDKDSLGNALLRILGDSELCTKLGNNGKRLVSEKFEWNKIVDRLESIYQSVISYSHHG